MVAIPKSQIPPLKKDSLTDDNLSLRTRLKIIQIVPSTTRQIYNPTNEIIHLYGLCGDGTVLVLTDSNVGGEEPTWRKLPPTPFVSS